MRLTSAQKSALERACEWFRSRKSQQVFRIDGPAGSGKTSVVKAIIEAISADAAYLAPTNKAADLLRKAGCQPVFTLHKALYTTRSEEDENSKRQILNFDSRFDDEHADNIIGDYELLVIDEASMVGTMLAKELLRYERPTVVLGDRAQLAPVNDDAYFTNDRFVPIDVALDTVVRQEAQSELLRAATSLRLGRGFGNTGVFLGSKDIHDLGCELAQADQVLCHTNYQRLRINALTRKILGFTKGLHIGDKLVAKKNDYRNGIFKGTLWRVIEFEGPRARLLPWDSPPDTDPVDAVSVSVKGINSEHPEFEFGYAITVHSAQGSEWRNVIIVGSRLPDRIAGSTSNRWWYTAVTRASDSATAIVEPA